jgi:hypothetical protein
MIGDGIIVESIASFKITWKNPGNGMQAVWDQENQVIEIHGSDVYPDLEFVSLTGLSTYFTHSTADKIIAKLKELNKVIDTQLTELYKSKNQANEAVEASFANEIPKPKETETETEVDAANKIPEIKPEEVNKKDEVTNTEEPKVEPEVPKSTSEGFAYTVTVHGDKLRFIDASSETHTLVIKHKLSNNMGVKKETGETLDNSSRIWATVQLSGLFSETHRFNFEKFNISTDSTAENLLVQIIPSIQLTFKAGENMTTPETERETYVSKIALTKNQAKLKDLQRELEVYKKQLKKIGGTEPTEADLEAARKADTQ